MQALKPFEYFEPATVQEAARIALKYGDKATVFAGGVDLVPRMRLRKLRPEYLVILQSIPGLDYVESDGKGLRIGALTTLRSIELSPAVKKDYPVLYEAVHGIASTQVKAMSTAVGNLCVATPASDVAPPLSVLGAELKIASTGAEKVIPIEDLFIGVNKTALQPGEIITEILVPRPAAGTGGAFLKLMRTAADIAKVNVAVMLTVSGGTCKEAKVALGSVAPTLIRAGKAEGILKGAKLDREVIEAAAKAAAEEAKPITDVRSTAEYRKEATGVLVRRAIDKAIERVEA